MVESPGGSSLVLLSGGFSMDLPVLSLRARLQKLPGSSVVEA